MKGDFKLCPAEIPKTLSLCQVPTGLYPEKFCTHDFRGRNDDIGVPPEKSQRIPLKTLDFITTGT